MTPILPTYDNNPTVTSKSNQLEVSGSANQFTSTLSSRSNALPIGSKLGEFELIDIIGWGGFGIVYLAYDHSLQRQVALKEYMPSALATREHGIAVSIISEQHKETFQAGLRSFINEARLLAHFDHPSLVKVYRFWEDNGTAYMVMPFYQGLTLKETIRSMSTPPEEAWLKDLLSQILDVLDILHKDHCLHRDIAPDNILILSDGRALLLDFGAARRVISDMTQALTVILKPGYAPIEQYAEEHSMAQGPWSDIYALAAVLYFVITGHAPTPAVSRMISDTLIPLNKVAANRYSANFLSAIDRALAIRPEDRPKNIDELRTLLHIKKTQAEPVIEAKIAFSQNIKTENSKIIIKNNKRLGFFHVIAFITLIASGSIVGLFINHQSTEQSWHSTERVTLGIKPFDPASMLDEIFDGRDRSQAVAISLEKTQVQIGKDQLRFRIRSAKSGYIYLLMAGSKHSDFFLLFPNAVDKNNYIEANQQLELPRSKWKMVASGPAGINHFVLMVSDQPRDFSQAGLQHNDPFSEFPVDQGAQLYQTYAGPIPLFAGKAICSSLLNQECSESYGAAVFSIEEVD